MSAWAEACSPGLGWVAFDAVHDLCAERPLHPRRRRPRRQGRRAGAGLDQCRRDVRSPRGCGWSRRRRKGRTSAAPRRRCQVCLCRSAGDLGVDAASRLASQLLAARAAGEAGGCRRRSLRRGALRSIDGHDRSAECESHFEAVRASSSRGHVRSVDDADFTPPGGRDRAGADARRAAHMFASSSRAAVRQLQRAGRDGLEERCVAPRRRLSAEMTACDDAFGGRTAPGHMRRRPRLEAYVVNRAATLACSLVGRTPTSPAMRLMQGVAATHVRRS